MEAFCTERAVYVKVPEEIEHFLETTSSWVFLEHKMWIMAGGEWKEAKDKTELISWGKPIMTYNVIQGSLEFILSWWN